MLTEYLKWLASVFFLLTASVSHAKIQKYNLDIAYQSVNVTGTSVKAMAIGGSIPGPTIEASVGDTLRVTFNNQMDVETSIHWHGVLLPNDQDGVPYLTTAPIQPGTSFTYEFPITHSGTYWYHSHTGLQEQRGIYGGLVFHPETANTKYSQDQVLVFSDWTNENPKQVLANLKKDGDYYALKKDSVQSWIKVIQNGKQGIANRILGSLSRMGPMDISDVGYDAFLTNGVTKLNLCSAQKGDKIRLRLINAAASSYFNVEFSGGNMTIIAADGIDVEPTEVSRLRMAIAETFDVVISIPNNQSYELRATAEDGTGYTSTIFGSAELVAANSIARPNLFLMDHSVHAMNSMNQQPKAIMNHSGMHHKSKSLKQLNEYDVLRATKVTTLPADNPIREVNLELTGNMERYIWSFNNKTLSESSQIFIKKGETVRFKLTNRTMMHHPIHLHGHFFRVLNGQGDYSPLKHTVNVPPMQSVEIEFLANEEKDWFFHCHNLYHMKAGMAAVVSYQGTSTANKNLLRKLAGDSDWYFMGHIGVHTNMIEGHFRPSDKRNAFDIEFNYNYEEEYDIEAIYERSLSRLLDIYLGGEFEKEEGESENRAILGFHYLLPLLVELDIRIDSNGKPRLGLESDLQLSDRLAFEWGINSDLEYRCMLDYEVSKTLSFSANYDSDYHAGAGIKISF